MVNFSFVKTSSLRKLFGTHLDMSGGVVSGTSIVSIIAISDIVFVFLFFFLSCLDSRGVPDDYARIWRSSDAIFGFSVLYAMLASGGYSLSLKDNPFSQISRILVNSTVLALMEWLVLTATGISDGFLWPWHGPLVLIGGGCLAMCAVRVGMYEVLLSQAKSGHIRCSIAIVGAGKEGARVIEALEARKDPGSSVIGIFDERVTGRSDELELNAQGTISDLIDYARHSRVDEILVALPWGAEDRLLLILNKLKVIPANIRLAPDVIGHHFLDRGFDRMANLPVYNIYKKPISEWEALMKRAEDIILSITALILLSPVMLATAIAVRLSGTGPVLFRQNRYGYNNLLIGVYKFRSMHHAMRDENATKLTVQDDPRITRVGKFIRKTSLDELPQLFNVLLGNMSMVGPRPHATQAKAAGKLYQEVVSGYVLRHKIKPGITGWAQVMGWRGETDTEEKIVKRVECDLYYIENWSIFLDIEILFRTALVVTGGNVF